jgi:hypothetical protein
MHAASKFLSATVGLEKGQLTSIVHKSKRNTKFLKKNQPMLNMATVYLLKMKVRIYIEDECDLL